nr:hypothetical protein [Tanacetum cinerariifolium]
KPPAGLAAAVDELSPTSYLGPKAISNFFRGGTGAGIEILAVVRYAGCGGSVAANSFVLNGSVSSADGAWSAAVGATTTESEG